MYQNQPSPQGQWNPNAPPTSQAPQWSPQPPNGQYAQRQGQNQNQIPPITQALPQGSPMQTLQPQHPDHYRALPAPPQMYAQPYQPHQQMQYPPPQPAPRQRTAIACRYCRRRKIRCSGFDQSEDGRCTNCQRFSQECVFTPVSSQAQAFVPAHTVWRGQNPPPNAQLYGAYGQPLPQGNRDPYPPQQSPGQYPPPPQGYQQPPMYQQGPPPQGGAGQKRSSDEPHTPTLPPPNPGAQAQVPRDGQPFSYPDPSGLTAAGASPASSTASFNSAQPHTQPYFAQPTPPVYHASPQGAYPYDTSRASSSPQTFGAPTPPTANGLHPMVPNRTPTPGSAQANAQRQGVKINELVGQGGQSKQQQQQQQEVGQTNVQQEERTSTDTNHGDPPTDPSIVSDGGVAKRDEPTPKRNGVVDAGVQTDVSGPPAREQAS